MGEPVKFAQNGVHLASLISTVRHVKATTMVQPANTHVDKIVKIHATKNMDSALMVVQMVNSLLKTLLSVLSARLIANYVSQKLYAPSVCPVTMVTRVKTDVPGIARLAAN